MVTVGVGRLVEVAVAVAVGVAVWVRVAVAVGVLVSAPVAVGVAVWVRVAVAVGVLVSAPGAVGVTVGVRVAVAVAVGVPIWGCVAVGVAVGVLVSAPGAVGVTVGVWVAVAVTVGVLVEVAVAVGAAAQLREMVLASNVTAPVCARARPFKLAPVFRVMDVSARIFPMNLVFVPRVAELPTLHHALHGSPPVTDEPDDVMSVDADLKIQTPDPARVRFPLSAKEPRAQ